MQDPFMAKAIELSVENVRSGAGGPFAAVVVKDGKIIAEGTNQVTATNDPSAHAEIVAIRRACKALNNFQLTDCEIYSTCEPCSMCMAAIYWARPARVHFAASGSDAAAYGFNESMIHEQIQLPWSKRSIPMTQVMRAEALEAFAEWKKKPDRIEY